MIRWLVIDKRDDSKLGDFGDREAATERMEKLNAEDGPYYVLRQQSVTNTYAFTERR